MTSKKEKEKVLMPAAVAVIVAIIFIFLFFITSTVTIQRVELRNRQIKEAQIEARRIEVERVKALRVASQKESERRMNSEKDDLKGLILLSSKERIVVDLQGNEQAEGMAKEFKMNRQTMVVLTKETSDEEDDIVGNIEDLKLGAMVKISEVNGTVKTVWIQ